LLPHCVRLFARAATATGVGATVVVVRAMGSEEAVAALVVVRVEEASRVEGEGVEASKNLGFDPTGFDRQPS